MLCGIGGMREVTGLSLSVGALMLGRRELLTKAPGVYAPEACIPPVPFITAMMGKGLGCFEDLAMIDPHDPDERVIVAVQWGDPDVIVYRRKFRISQGTR